MSLGKTQVWASILVLGLTVPLGRASRTIRGTVTDASGTLVPGVSILRLDPKVARRCPDPYLGSMDNLFLVVSQAEDPARESRSEWSARTGADGQFETPPLEQREGQELVLATSEGFAPQLSILDHRSQASIILRRGSDLVVHVLTETGKPVAEAQAILIPLSVCEAAIKAHMDLLVPNAQADSEGALEIRNVPNGVYALRLTATGRVASNVGPLVIEDDRSEFNVRMPQAIPYKGNVEFPAHTSQSPGTVLAFWRDRVGVPQWNETRFPDGHAPFDMDGLPVGNSVNFLARTESGLSTKWVTRDRLGSSGGGRTQSFLLRPPLGWQGRLEEGMEVTSLIVQPIFPASCPPVISRKTFLVQVHSDKSFVIPNLSPVAEGLRIASPGIGETELPLEEDAGENLGVLKIPHGQTVEGTVSWDDSSPLGDAQIQVLLDGRVLCSARTTSEGRFSCAAGEISARRITFRAITDAVDLRLAPVPGRESSLLVSSPSGSIQLNISRPAGGGNVKDIQIEIESGRAREDGSRPSVRRIVYAHSSAGRFTLHAVEEGPSHFVVSSPEGGPKSKSTLKVPATGPPAEAKLLLPWGPLTSGTVSSKSTKIPITGAQVEMGVKVNNPESAEVTRIQRTTSDGSWRFANVPEGAYQLSAWAEGYTRATKEIIISTEPEHVPLELFLERPGGVRGKVHGLPSESTSTLSLDSASLGLEGDSYQGKVDDQGQFAFENVRPDQYELSLRVREASKGVLTRYVDLQVRPGETNEVDIDLKSGTNVSGRAYLGEESLSNWRLVFLRQSDRTLFDSVDSSRTDEQGKYSVILPSAGQYGVRAYPGPPNNRGPGIDLDGLLEIGHESVQNRDLRFSNGRIRGRVVSSIGRPIRGAYIVVTKSRPLEDIHDDQKSTGDFQDQTHSEEAGVFEFGPVPVGDFRLDISARGFARKQAGPYHIGMNQSLDTSDIVLDSQQPLLAKAVSEQGLPQLNADVYAFPDSTLDTPRGTGTTGENGEVLLNGLSAGTYLLVGILQGWPPAFSKQVTVPQDVTAVPPLLQFVRGGGLEVQVLDRSGEPVANLIPHIITDDGLDVTVPYLLVADHNKSPWVTDAEGYARMAAMLPGDYSVRIGFGDRSDMRKVTVSVGQTSQVKLVATEAAAP